MKQFLAGDCVVAARPTRCRNVSDGRLKARNRDVFLEGGSADRLVRNLPCGTITHSLCPASARGRIACGVSSWPRLSAPGIPQEERGTQPVFLIARPAWVCLPRTGGQREAEPAEDGVAGGLTGSTKLCDVTLDPSPWHRTGWAGQEAVKRLAHRGAGGRRLGPTWHVCARGRPGLYERRSCLPIPPAVAEYASTPPSEDCCLRSA